MKTNNQKGLVSITNYLLVFLFFTGIISVINKQER